MDEPYDYYLKSISNLTDKMVPADYLYLSDKIWDFKDRLDEIKKGDMEFYDHTPPDDYEGGYCRVCDRPCYGNDICSQACFEAFMR